nr:DUF4350 domain-containing protein [Desulfobulbaceae bacterium]
MLFDQGHGQQFLIENNGPLDLSIFAGMFRDQNFEIRTSTGPFTKETLANVSTVIISGPFKPITVPEIVALQEFLNEGGQLSIMLHIGSPAAQLLSSLGVAISNGVIQEQKNLLADAPPTDFIVKELASSHPLTKELTEVKFYGAWALNTQLEANVIAKTSPTAWIDLNDNGTLETNDAVQPFSVIITGQLGHGHFIVFADDAIFQNSFITEQNKVLAANLAAWLKQGSYY